MPPALDHQWLTISEHPTSEGPVVYQRCPCGLWRIEHGGARQVGRLDAQRAVSSNSGTERAAAWPTGRGSDGM